MCLYMCIHTNTFYLYICSGNVKLSHFAEFLPLRFYIKTKKKPKTPFKINFYKIFCTKIKCQFYC